MTMLGRCTITCLCGASQAAGDTGDDIERFLRTCVPLGWGFNDWGFALCPGCLSVPLDPEPARPVPKAETEAMGQQALFAQEVRR